MKKLIIGIFSHERVDKVINFLMKIWAAICRLFPVKNRVLFFTVRADGRLLENSKAVYDALDCEKKIFAKKLPHNYKVEPFAIYWLLTSRVIVSDDYCRYLRKIKLRKNQKFFQIWHGCGAFKSFGLDVKSKLTPDEERATHSQYDAVAVTGEDCRKYFARAFGISEEKCLALGLPRTDYLINNADEMRAEFYDKHPELKDKQIYLYCPTFRENDGERVEYNPGIDWKEMNNSLEDNEIFIVSRHPMVDYELIDGKYEKIVDMTEESTLSLASASSVLITDYSSTVHDATLLGVPMVFYCPDYREYERMFYLNFPDDLPGEMITEGEKLLDVVRRAKKEPPVDKIEKFRKGQLGACDGHSTQRVVEIINGWMK